MNLYLIAAGAGYLLGSLPFGWLVAKAHGVDIFAVGSCSSGATNVRRTLGARAGNTVFALDVLKGAAAAGWPILAFHAEDLGLVGAVLALVGHSFSCFTRFRGGKGVATAAGGVLVLMPGVALIAAAVWTIVFYSTRYVSLASILAAAATPIAAYFVSASGGRETQTLMTLAGLATGGFVVFRHRANIGRLLQGTENKAGRK